MYIQQACIENDTAEAGDDRNRDGVKQMDMREGRQSVKAENKTAAE